MKRARVTWPVAALLLLVLTQDPIAQPGPSFSRRPLPGPDGIWNKVYWYPAGDTGIPDPQGVVFDPKRGQLVRFTSDYTWFEPISPHGPPPTYWPGLRPGIPIAYSAIYDSRRGRIVILTFDSLVFEMGTFTLSPDEPATWSRVVPFGASPDLAYASSIYDPLEDRMVVYGGVDFNESSSPVGQVWSLSLGGEVAWKRIEPRGPAPAPRVNHSAIFDAEHGAMVVYGGLSEFGADALGDTWRLDFAPEPRWRHITTPGDSPASRGDHTAVYDPTRGRMIIAGGYAVWSPLFGQAFDDIWELPLDGPPRWRRMNPPGESPPAINSRLAFVDAVNDRMILTSDEGAFVWTLNWTSVPGTVFVNPQPPGRMGMGGPDPSLADAPSLRVPSVLWRGGSFTARVSLPFASAGSLSLFDASGRRVWIAHTKVLTAGTHDVVIEVSERLAPGVFFLRLDLGEHSEVAKIVRLF